MNRLTQLTGKNISTPEDLYYLYHTLTAEQSLGLTLPEWTKDIFPRGELWDGTVLSYNIANWTPMLRRLYGGNIRFLLNVQFIILLFLRFSRSCVFFIFDIASCYPNSPKLCNFYFFSRRIPYLLISVWNIFNHFYSIPELWIVVSVSGPFLRIITKSFLDVVTGTQKRDVMMNLFSGHESNVAAVLHALNVYYPHVPEYSSAVVMELHHIRNNYYVKVCNKEMYKLYLLSYFVWNIFLIVIRWNIGYSFNSFNYFVLQVLNYLGIPSKIIELQMPGCDKLCPLDKYLALIEEVMPSHEDLICNKGLSAEFANRKSIEASDLLKYNLIRSAGAARNT